MRQPSTQPATAVKPKKYRSPLRYPGGKQRATQRIATLFPDGIEEYREPMVGGGSVYLHARSLNLAKRYWINDKFKDLILFWKAVKDPEICSQLQEDLYKLRRSLRTAKRIKEYFLDTRFETPASDYEAALLFFFLNRVSFSGTTQAGGFSSAASILRFTDSSIDRLGPMPEALDGTRITNNDFRIPVTKEGENVFLFLDPPYYTASKLYGKNGKLHDFPHDELAELLQITPHKFLLTYDDCEPIRDLYSWANMRVRAKVKVEEWTLTYGMNNCNSSNTCKVGAELFISNY